MGFISFAILLLNIFGLTNCSRNNKYQAHIAHMIRTGYLPETCFPQTDEKDCKYWRHVAIMIENGKECPATLQYTRRSHLQSQMVADRIDPEDYCDKNPIVVDEGGVDGDDDGGTTEVIYNIVCKYCITGPDPGREYFYASELVGQRDFVYPHSNYKCSKHTIRINGTCIN